jgi:hypothetical protein
MLRIVFASGDKKEIRLVNSNVSPAFVAAASAARNAQAFLTTCSEEVSVNMDCRKCARCGTACATTCNCLVSGIRMMNIARQRYKKQKNSVTL